MSVEPVDGVEAVLPPQQKLIMRHALIIVSDLTEPLLLGFQTNPSLTETQVTKVRHSKSSN